MPLRVGCSQEVISDNIKHLRQKGYPQKTAIAIAYDLARKHKKMCSLKRQRKLAKKNKKKHRARPILGLF
jgi:hypothetical protein